jgi:hypothetical protein
MHRAFGEQGEDRRPDVAAPPPPARSAASPPAAPAEPFPRSMRWRPRRARWKWWHWGKSARLSRLEAALDVPPERPAIPMPVSAFSAVTKLRSHVNLLL